MKTINKMQYNATVLIGALFLAGCARTPPSVTEAEGRILLDGRPLPMAQVEFVPQLKGFAAEWNSIGATDADGVFHLNCASKGQNGAVVGAHWVLVTELPVADEFRSGDCQGRYADYLKSLSNRPIPQSYESVRTTPLRVEVKKDQKTYDLLLTR